MALEDVEVGTADSRVFNLDDCVGGFLDFRLGFVFEDDLVKAAVDEGFHGGWTLESAIRLCLLGRSCLLGRLC